MKNQFGRIFRQALQIITLCLLGTTIEVNAFGGIVVSWGDDCSVTPTGLTNIMAIDCYNMHSLALRNDGTVVAWGNERDSAINVPPNLSNVVAIAVGSAHDLALRNDGTVVAWGSGDIRGQTNVPPDLTNAIAVAAGAYHSLALKADGTVVAWGEYVVGMTSSGQWYVFAPAYVPSGLSNVMAIAASSSHSLALKSDGTVVAWGRNGSGQTNVPVDLTNVTAIAAGIVNAAAVKTDGTVVDWGNSYYGQTNVPTFLTNAVDIAVGLYHGLALTADGKVVAWGHNKLNGGIYYAVTNVPPGLSNVAAIAASTYQSMALVTNLIPLPEITTQPASQTNYAGTTVTFTAAAGSLSQSPMHYQWRKNGVDLVDSGNVSGATTTTLALANVQNADATGYSVFVSNEFGSTISSNAVLVVSDAPFITEPPESRTMRIGLDVTFTVGGIYGLPPFSYQWQFNGVDIPGETNTTLVLTGITTNDTGLYSVVVQNAYGTAVSTAATLKPLVSSVVAWGDNDSGQCDVPDGLTNVVAVAAGVYSSYALKSDGTIAVWGNPYDTTVWVYDDVEDYYYEESLEDLRDVVAIAAGYFHTLALKSDGTVVAWGQDVAYSCCDWFNTVPPGLKNVVAIAAGADCSLALKRDGTVVAWGNGVSDYPIPAGLTGVRAIAARDQQFMALQSDGVVVEWGQYGNYRSDEFDVSSNIVAVATDWGDTLYLLADGNVWEAYGWNNPQATNAVAVDVGGNCCLALKADSTVAAWCNWDEGNEYGQTNIPPGLTNVLAIAGGFDHCLALVDDRSLTNGTELDTNKPTVRITSPANNATLYNGTLKVRGTAGDDMNVSRVLLQVNDGPFRPVLGTTCWKTSVNLRVGKNRLAAKSVDWAGNESAVKVVDVFYAVPSTLTVLVNGSGTVTPPPDAPNLYLARNYNISATADANNLFSNWLSVVDGVTNVVSSNAKFTFMMQSNLTLIADFVTNGFIEAAGTYYGLFSDTNNGVAQQSAGFVKMTTTTKQKFSGQLQLDGGKASFAGKFDLGGNAVINSVKRTGKSSLNINLRLCLDGGDQVTGTVSEATNGWSSTLLGDRAVFKTSNPATNFWSRYTMLLPGCTNAAVAPAGNGYGLINVSASGVPTISGKLGNGQPLKPSAAAVSKRGDYPLYSPSSNGCLIGWVNFTNLPQRTLTGNPAWIKCSGNEGFYNAGFTNEIAIVGSGYTSPGSGGRTINITNGAVSLKDGNLPGPVTNLVTISDANKITMVQTNIPMKSPTFTKSGGLLSGKFVHPATGVQTDMKGVYLQNQNYVGGYFLGTNQSGSVKLQER